MDKKITVSKKDNKHVCELTHTHVRTGDKVKWVNATGGTIAIEFSGETPFDEGKGPFIGSEAIQTVRHGPPLKPGQTFQPAIVLDGQLLPTTGDIIFDGG